MSDSGPSPAAEFPKRLDPVTADRLIALARSPKSSDVDQLIKLGLTQGLSHPRFVIQDIEAESGQKYARESVTLARSNVQVARLLLWVTIVAAIAAVANAVAAIILAVS